MCGKLEASDEAVASGRAFGEAFRRCGVRQAAAGGKRFIFFGGARRNVRDRRRVWIWKNYGRALCPAPDRTDERADHDRRRGTRFPLEGGTPRYSVQNATRVPGAF